MSEITHTIDKKTGRVIQIVASERLRKVLDEQGENYDRPRDFGPDDEWNVGGDLSGTS